MGTIETSNPPERPSSADLIQAAATLRAYAAWCADGPRASDADRFAVKRIDELSSTGNPGTNAAMVVNGAVFALAWVQQEREAAHR